MIKREDVSAFDKLIQFHVKLHFLTYISTINAENGKLFIFSLEKSLRRNKSLKVIRFVCVIYCFINTFERNLFSIGAFNSSRLIPNHFFGFSTARKLSPQHKSRINLKGDVSVNLFRSRTKFPCELKIELHNLCFCLANGHFQFQLVTCRRQNENELAETRLGARFVKGFKWLANIELK